jgi:ribosomal protein RSM22 (predicted rRNA methylase)
MTPAGDHLPENFYDLREEVARLQEQLKASEKALVLANSVMDAWRASSNEWRGALTDANTRFATTKEVEAMIAKEEAERKGLAATVAALEKSRFELAGRSTGIGTSWGIVATVIVMLIGIAEVLVLVKWR